MYRRRQGDDPLGANTCSRAASNPGCYCWPGEANLVVSRFQASRARPSLTAFATPPNRAAICIAAHHVHGVREVSALDGLAELDEECRVLKRIDKPMRQRHVFGSRTNVPVRVHEHPCDQTPAVRGGVTVGHCDDRIDAVLPHDEGFGVKATMGYGATESDQLVLRQCRHVNKSQPLGQRTSVEPFPLKVGNEPVDHVRENDVKATEGPSRPDDGRSDGETRVLNSGRCADGAAVARSVLISQLGERDSELACCLGHVADRAFGS